MASSWVQPADAIVGALMAIDEGFQYFLRMWSWKHLQKILFLGRFSFHTAFKAVPWSVEGCPCSSVRPRSICRHIRYDVPTL
jgi:hypothetical protein